jgi:leucyl/phenylalanyl-tRNA--protein transferase
LIDDTATTFMAIVDSLRMTAQPRVTLLRSVPTAPQVIANYTRGFILFGRSPAIPSRFMWRSYPTRSIITPETAKIPRDVRRTQRRSDLKIKFNEDFEDIVHACLEGRDHWVWMTPGVIDVYRELHRLGFVATVGVYRDDNLVAGLWGISVGRVFGIMSAFHRENGAGSLAIGAVVESVADDGRWSIIDNGLVSANYARFGAFEVPTEKLCEMMWQTLHSAPPVSPPAS